MSSGVAYYGGPWSKGRPPLPDQVTPRHLDLMFFGVVSLNSAVLTILPLVGLVLGGVLGAVASKRRSS